MSELVVRQRTSALDMHFAADETQQLSSAVLLLLLDLLLL